MAQDQNWWVVDFLLPTNRLWTVSRIIQTGIVEDFSTTPSCGLRHALARQDLVPLTVYIVENFTEKNKQVLRRQATFANVQAAESTQTERFC
jgi:hypothetical protein